MVFLQLCIIFESGFKKLPLIVALFFANFAIYSSMRMEFLKAVYNLLHMTMILLYVRGSEYFPFLALVFHAGQLIVFSTLDVQSQLEMMEVLRLTLSLFYFLSSAKIQMTQYRDLLRFSLTGFFLGIFTDLSLFNCFCTLLTSQKIFF